MSDPTATQMADALKRFWRRLNERTGINAELLSPSKRPLMTFNRIGPLVECIANSNPDPRAAGLARAFGQTAEPQGIATMTDIERRGF